MSSRLSLSNVRLNNVGLACVTLLLLLLIGVSSFTTVNGNEFDDSESHSGRSRLHHSRPSSASSAILDAHQEVVPISLVESLAEESHAVEVDVGSDFITVYGDEENEELITDINEEDQAMAAVRAGYEQRQQQQGQLNSAVKKFSRTAMTKRQQELASQKAAQTAEAQLKGQAAKNKKSSVPSRRRTSGGINKKYLTARNGPTRAVRKKLGVFLELETELESELESESELKSMVAVGAYPAYSLGAAPGGILQTVGILRNAIQADPAPPAHPPLELNGFTYVLDGGAAGAQVGRIQSVRGDVRPPVTTRPVKQLPVEWCDVQFNPNAPFVGPLVLAGRTRAAGGGRRIQQSGHIIGYAIGGSSDHAINFYPQHRSSNNQGGRWGKTEAIALHVAAACPFAIVTVDIVFTAWHANGYPTAGNYRVEADAGCVAALGVNCVQTGAAGPAVPVGVGNAYVRTFCRWAAAPGGGVLRYSSPFSNGVGDVINNLGPLAAQYFP